METKNNFQIKLSRKDKLEDNTLYVTPIIALIDTPYSVTLTKSSEKLYENCFLGLSTSMFSLSFLMKFN